MRRSFLVVAALMLLSVVVPGFARADASIGYCVQVMETGQATCFDTEHELTAFQEEAALQPLVTMFRDANYVGAGGYRNYVSAYGRDACDSSKSTREASSGNLELQRFNTGQIMNDQISSFVIRSRTFCEVSIYENAGFQSAIVGRTTQSCPHLDRCIYSGIFAVSFNDVVSSVGVS